MARRKVDKGVTLIASHTEVVGDVKFTDQLYVSGRISGNVASDDEQATVVISPEGWINGEVRVSNVIINGMVQGDVFASNKVELAAQAKVQGNVHYKMIELQLGALVDGQLVHDEEVSAEQNGASAEAHQE